MEHGNPPDINPVVSSSVSCGCDGKELYDVDVFGGKQSEKMKLCKDHNIYQDFDITIKIANCFTYDELIEIAKKLNNGFNPDWNL